MLLSVFDICVFLWSESIALESNYVITVLTETEKFHRWRWGERSEPCKDRGFNNVVPFMATISCPKEIFTCHGWYVFIETTKKKKKHFKLKSLFNEKSLVQKSHQKNTQT